MSELLLVVLEAVIKAGLILAAVAIAAILSRLADPEPVLPPTSLALSESPPLPLGEGAGG